MKARPTACGCGRCLRRRYGFPCGAGTALLAAVVLCLLLNGCGFIGNLSGSGIDGTESSAMTRTMSAENISSTRPTGSELRDGAAAGNTGLSLPSNQSSSGSSDSAAADGRNNRSPFDIIPADSLGWLQISSQAENNGFSFSFLEPDENSTENQLFRIRETDGSLDEITHRDGSSIIRRADGTMVIEDVLHVLMEISPEGTCTVKYPDGTVLSRSDDGRIIYDHKGGGIYKVAPSPAYFSATVFIPPKIEFDSCWWVTPNPAETGYNSDEVYLSFQFADGTVLKILNQYGTERIDLTLPDGTQVRKHGTGMTVDTSAGIQVICTAPNAQAPLKSQLKIDGEELPPIFSVSQESLQAGNEETSEGTNPEENEESSVLYTYPDGVSVEVFKETIRYTAPNGREWLLPGESGGPLENQGTGGVQSSDADSSILPENPPESAQTGSPSSETETGTDLSGNAGSSDSTVTVKESGSDRDTDEPSTINRILLSVSELFKDIAPLLAAMMVAVISVLQWRRRRQKIITAEEETRRISDKTAKNAELLASQKAGKPEKPSVSIPPAVSTQKDSALSDHEKERESGNQPAAEPVFRVSIMLETSGHNKPEQVILTANMQGKLEVKKAEGFEDEYRASPVLSDSYISEADLDSSEVSACFIIDNIPSETEMWYKVICIPAVLSTQSGYENRFILKEKGRLTLI